MPAIIRWLLLIRMAYFTKINGVPLQISRGRGNSGTVYLFYRARMAPREISKLSLNYQYPRDMSQYRKDTAKPDVEAYVVGGKFGAL